MFLISDLKYNFQKESNFTDGGPRVHVHHIVVYNAKNLSTNQSERVHIETTIVESYRRFIGDKVYVKHVHRIQLMHLYNLKF